MKNELKIELSGNRKIIAEINNYDGKHKELCVYIVDDTDKENVEYQDICLVREDEKEPDRVECLVWGNQDSEDYTDRFSIGKNNECEE